MDPIPRNIFQTWYSKSIPPDMKQCTDMLRQNNPEFAYHLYDNEDCRELIKNNFDDNVLKTFDDLIPGAYKADLWRLCVLYVYGGIYLDIKFYPAEGFKFLDIIDREHYVKDAWISGGGIYNAFMVCRKGNSLLLKCINKIVENNRSRYYGTIFGCLEISGPLLLKDVFSESDDVTNIDMKSILVLDGDGKKMHISYNGKYILKQYNSYRKEIRKSTHYTITWATGGVYSGHRTNIVFLWLLILFNTFIRVARDVLRNVRKRIRIWI